MAKYFTLVYDESIPQVKPMVLDLQGAGAVLACCVGDALLERDAYKWALERNGVNPEVAVAAYLKMKDGA